MHKTQTVGSYGNTLTTDYIESNNTLLFDIRTKDHETICNNLTVEQAKAMREILDDFIAKQPIKVVVEGSAHVIDVLRRNENLTVTDI